jgi:hypothetical protein
MDLSVGKAPLFVFALIVKKSLFPLKGQWSTELELQIDIEGGNSEKEELSPTPHTHGFTVVLIFLPDRGLCLILWSPDSVEHLFHAFIRFLWEEAAVDKEAHNGICTEATMYSWSSNEYVMTPTPIRSIWWMKSGFEFLFTEYLVWNTPVLDF